MITDGFEPGDDEAVVAILGKWRGGALSTPLYTVLAGIIPVSVVETVILRRNGEGDLEVLLIPRPASDVVWKGMLYSPGGTFRAADFKRRDGVPINGIFERITSAQIQMPFLGRPRFAGYDAYSTSRGNEVVQCYLAEVAPDAELPEGAGWYRVDDLLDMERFISHQITPIKIACGQFTQLERPTLSFRAKWHIFCEAALDLVGLKQAD